MARTYRKKNSNWEFYTWNYEYQEAQNQCGGVYLKKVPLEHSSKEYQKKHMVFHGQKYCNGIPRKYIRMNFQKPLRQKSRIMLGKWTVKETSDIIFPEFVRNAGWYFY